MSDPADARWLLACVWPDTGRAERVEASIRLAQQDPPTVVAGRANDVLPSVLAGLPAGATAIVTTTWAFSYFSMEERAEFVELLRAESRRRRVVWVSADVAGVVEALGAVDSSDRDVLGAVLLDGGAGPAHGPRLRASPRQLDRLASVSLTTGVDQAKHAPPVLTTARH